MSGTIRVTRFRTRGYRRTYSGEVEVCCHRVAYWYDIAGVRMTQEALDQLEAEAEERAQTCIIDGCPMGDLNAVINGETEVFGAWQITRD